MNSVYIYQVAHLLVRKMLLLLDLVMYLTAYFSSVERSVGLAFLDSSSLVQMFYFCHLVKGRCGSLGGQVLRAAIQHCSTVALRRVTWHNPACNENHLAINVSVP